MLWPVLIAGFTLGAVGSLHCVGMCGPLAMALPMGHLTHAGRFLSLLFYQFGRIITYSVIGLLFGLAGRQIYLAGIQQWFSIIIGIIVLTVVVLYYVYKRPLQLRLFARLYGFVQTFMMRFFRSRNKSIGFLLLGMANGLLPCGMIYMAVAGALTASQVLHSILFMTAFGMGTLPAMMIVGYFGSRVTLQVRNRFRQGIPIFMALVGVVLLLRGMNLGIPFLSPVLHDAPHAVISCGAQTATN